MWHGLGIVLPDYPTREAAIIAAGHDFTVVEHELYLKRESTPETQFERATFTFPKVPGFKAVANSKTGTIFAVHQDSYQVIDNTVGWDLSDLMAGSENVKYETAGVLKDGAICWVLLKVDEPYQVVGDDSPIYPFITVNWTHDGSGALRCAATDVRIVCFNTYSMAMGKAEREGREFTFRHTKNVAARIDEAKAAIAGARKASAEFRELSNELATVPVTDEQRELFVKAMFPSPTSDVLISDRVLDNIEEARGQLRSIFSSPTIPDAHRNTAYGLVQAGIEYLDHYRAARSAETKFSRTLLRQEPLKAKLVPMVRELVSA
jgi:phage/plasmid-like protein (TIGR03299 family)